MESLLYTIKQTATLLNVGRSTVYNLMDQGKLPSVKVGGSRRITRSALDKYVDELEVDRPEQSHKGLKIRVEP